MVHFHWGDNRFDIPNFPETCAQKALRYTDGQRTRKALDAGCGLGRASFELARAFDDVTGIDIDTSYVKGALRLKESGALPYTTVEEGEITRECEVRLRKFGLEHASKKVNFWQADACRLNPVFCGYDLVLACNLLERLYDPRAFLTLVKERLLSGGMLVLASAYDWDERHTPKEKWLGGVVRGNNAVTTLEGIRASLGETFSLVATEEVPFAKPCTARLYRYGVAELSVWQKR